MNMELELIAKVQKVQFEQSEYWRLRKQYGNATQQLEKCKQLEKELKRYCEERRKVLESKQVELFT